MNRHVFVMNTGILLDSLGTYTGKSVYFLSSTASVIPTLGVEHVLHSVWIINKVRSHISGGPALHSFELFAIKTIVIV